jgi:hypothetical protein
MAALTCGMHDVHVRCCLHAVLLLSVALQPENVCGLVCMLLAEAVAAGTAMAAAGHRPPSGPSPTALADDGSALPQNLHMSDHWFMPVLMVACGTQPDISICQRWPVLAQCMQRWSTLHRRAFGSSCNSYQE